MTDDTEAVLTQALQGDAEAIKAIAQKLKAPPILDVVRAADERMNFREEASAFLARHKEDFKDQSFYQEVVAEDTAITRAAPAMSYRDRMELAFRSAKDKRKAVRKQDREEEPSVDQEALDTQEALDRYRKDRRQPIMNMDEADMTPEEDEEEKYRREAIRGMAKDRGRRNLQEGD